MAIATLYTELDLDMTKFQAKQRKLLDDIKKVGADSETALQRSFMNLGVTSDSVYKLMVEKAQVSYEQIAQSGKSSAAEQVRAQQAMVSQIKAINDKMAEGANAHYATLGMKSAASINEQRANIEKAATAQQAIVGKSSEDWIRIERAKNEKLKELNKEMTGEHEMSMASMMRTILRWYAAYYVISSALEVLFVPLEKGFKAVEEYNTSIASMAAMVMSFSEKSKDISLSEQWKLALNYSTAIIPVLEQIAARTLLSGQETMALANAFARSGVFLDSTNAKQIEAFAMISNALPLMTKGQEIMRQINTEIRSVMTGANEQSSMMLITLKSIDPKIEEHLKIWRSQGTVLEEIGKLLSGFLPATALLEMQWQAVKSTLDTTTTQILRGLMKPAYEEIIVLVKELNTLLLTNKNAILDWGDAVAERMKMIKGIVDTITPFVKIFMGTPYKPSTKNEANAFGANEFGLRGEAIYSPLPKGIIGEDEAASKAAMHKAAEIQKLKVDLWIKDEARKWEALEKYEKDYQGIVDKALQEELALFAKREEENSKYLEQMKKDAIKEQEDLVKSEGELFALREKENADYFVKLKANQEQAAEVYRRIMISEDSFDTDRREQEMKRIIDREKEKYKIIDDLRKADLISAQQAENAKQKIIESTAAETRKLTSETFFKENSDREQAFSNMASNFDKMGQLYAADSRERQVLSNLSKAATIAEIALQVEKNLMIAIGAVVNQGTGDPYSAFARIAAMVAVVAGVLSIGGIAFGGGSGGSVAPSAAYGTGTTVLGGANNEGSQSISKSWELLQDTYDMEDTKLSGIYNEMKDLNQNITGIITAVVRMGSVDMMGLTPATGIGGAESTWRNFDEQMQSGFLGDNMIGRVVSQISHADVVGMWINRMIGNVIGDLLGGGQEEWGPSQTGIYVGQGGKDVKPYKEGTIRTSTEFWRKDQYDPYINFGETNEKLINLFSGPNGLYTNLQKTLTSLSGSLGGAQTDIDKAFADMVKEHKIDLAGLDLAGIEKKINEFASNLADVASETIFAELIQLYGKTNEGGYQTVLRLMVEKESVLSALEMTGKAFSGTAMQAVELSQVLIEIAGGLDKFTEAANTYYDKFFSDAEKQVRLQGQLSNAMILMNLTLPSTRAGYRALVEGFDLTIEWQREAYVTMLQLAEGADQYYSTLEDALTDATNAQNDYVESLKNISLTIDAWLNNLSLSTLSPVQSEAEWTRQYNEVQAKAMVSGASEQDVNAYLSFATKYLEMQQKYGTTGSYKEIYDRVVADVTGMQTGKNLALEIAQKQLNALLVIQSNTGTSAGVDVTIAQVEAAAAIARANEAVLAAEAIKNVANIDAVAIVAANVAIEVAQAAVTAWSPWNNYGESAPGQEALGNAFYGGNVIPFAAGGVISRPTLFNRSTGLGLMGEAGPEAIMPLKRGRGGKLGVESSGGESIIHNHIYIDGKEIQYVVTKGFKTNSDLIQSARRAVN